MTGSLAQNPWEMQWGQGNASLPPGQGTPSHGQGGQMPWEMNWGNGSAGALPNGSRPPGPAPVRLSPHPDEYQRPTNSPHPPESSPATANPHPLEINAPRQSPHGPLHAPTSQSPHPPLPAPTPPRAGNPDITDDSRAARGFGRSSYLNGMVAAPQIPPAQFGVDRATLERGDVVPAQSASLLDETDDARAQRGFGRSAALSGVVASPRIPQAQLGVDRSTLRQPTTPEGPRPSREEMVRLTEQFGANPATIPTPESVEAATIAPDRMPALNVPGVDLAPGSDVIFAEGDGHVVRDAEGGLSFSNGTFATSDRETIMRIMEGMSPASASMRAQNRATVAQRPISSRAATAFQGVPFVGSYLDEIATSIGGEQVGENILQAQQAVEGGYPTQSGLLRVAGTVAGIAPILAASGPNIVGQGTTRAAAMMSGALRGGIAGGVEGAVYGAGDQFGAGRQQNAINNGAVGGTLGAAGGAFVPLLDETLQHVLGRFRDQPADVIATELNVSPGAATMIRQALMAGDPEDAMRRLMQRGDDAMLADAGEAGAAMLDGAVNSGAPRAAVIGRNAVEQRVSRQNANLTGVIDDTLGAPLGRDTSIRSIRQGTAAERERMYSTAYGQPIDYASMEGRALEAALRRMPDSAIQHANQLSAADDAMRVAQGQEPAHRQILAEIGDNGQVTYSELPTVRQVHFLMQGLDQAASSGEVAGALGGRTPLSRSYEGVRRAVGARLSSVVPEFGQAQSRFADIAAEARAIETGYGLLRSTREATAMALDGASTAELASARQGLRSYLFDEVDRISAIASDPNMDARHLREMMSELTSARATAGIRQVMGRRQANELVGAIDEAMGALELRAAISRNSATAPRQGFADAAAEVSQGGMLEQLVDTNIRETGRRFVRVFAGDSREAQSIRTQGFMGEVARALTETRGPAAQRALRSINLAIEGQTLTPSQAELIGAVLSRGGVGLAHQEALRSLQVR